MGGAERQLTRRYREGMSCVFCAIVEGSVHAHVVLGLSDGTTRGGHLLEGHVWPTLEVVLDEPPTALRKTDRPEIGLALIDLAE